MFSLGTFAAGIRKANRKDLLLIALAEGTRVAGVFTRNRFCAAPVTVAKDHLHSGVPVRALVVNTGNANAGTGERGLAHARATCTEAARLLGLRADQMLPFSTGVIMEPLPLERIVAGLPGCIADLDEGNWLQAAGAIMTTDTLPKAASTRVRIGDVDVTVTGIAKGAGMIRPDMATMLCFVATDAPVSQTLLQKALEHAADLSFNSITVDGDTSTNDAFILMATGKAGGPEIVSEDGPEYAGFAQRDYRRRNEIGAGHHSRRRRRNEVHHTAHRAGTHGARVPQGSLCHRPLPIGEDCLLCIGSQSRSHTRSDRLCWSG